MLLGSSKTLFVPLRTAEESRLAFHLHLVGFKWIGGFRCCRFLPLFYCLFRHEFISSTDHSDFICLSLLKNNDSFFSSLQQLFLYLNIII